MGWDAYWNGRTTIYVNDLHKQIHYRGVAAEGVISLLPHESARVLDFGCGEALSADVVAKQARTLVLCDKAQVVREGLITRFESVENISVSAPEVIAVMPSPSFDLIIVNSVIQYLSRPELDALFAEWHRLLSPGGLLVVGDIVTPAGNMISDIRALLSFAACNKFFLSACAGLMRTFFSEYRSKRAQLGLLRLVRAHFWILSVLLVSTRPGAAGTWYNPVQIAGRGVEEHAAVWLSRSHSGGRLGALQCQMRSACATAVKSGLSPTRRYDQWR